MPKVLVEFNSIEEAQAAIAAVGATTPAPAPAAAPAPAPAAAPAPAPAPAPAAAPAQGVTIQQVEAAVTAYANAHGPAATKAKFAEVSATKISDIPPEQYANALTVFAV